MSKHGSVFASYFREISKSYDKKTPIYALGKHIYNKKAICFYWSPSLKT